MRRLSLSVRIVLLALVNLALLAGVFLAFAHVQFHLDWGSFLFAPARDRVVAVARDIALELEQTPDEARTHLMARYAAAYGVDFYLFENNGTQLAGRPVHLPDPVWDAVQRPPGPPPPRREEDRPRPGPNTFQFSADRLYWVGARIPIAEAGRDRPLRGTLLMSAASFYGTPLFFDFAPWLMASVATIAIFTLCWLPFIRGLTKTVGRITRATEQIAEGRFDQQLPEGRGDELGQLSAAINRMAARLAGFMGGQKRFLGDIAHELCAPIARMQFALGILEQRAEEHQRAAVEDVQEEMRQMSTLVNELMSFSKAGIESGQKALGPVDVAVTLREAVAREAAGGVEVAIDGPVVAMADAGLLLRSVSNLVRNAVRYAGDAGPIEVSARRQSGEIVVTVADVGPGLPEDSLERVFTPFYRLDSSRDRALGGTGLGLAIVKSCVEACRGKVLCRNRVPAGLEVEIRLQAV